MSSASSCSHVAAKTSAVHVIDPLNRTGKLTVPLSLISTTRGLEDHFEAEQGGQQRRTVKDLSLCLLFLKGRCMAGNGCNQIHVDADFIQQARAVASSSSNCCACHGDCASADLNAMSHVAVEIGGKKFTLNQFARTCALDSLLRVQGNSKVAIVLAASKVCRLQQEGRCKFGRDCKYIHVCRQSGFFDAPTAAPSVSVSVGVSKSSFAPAARAQPITFMSLPPPPPLTSFVPLALTSLVQFPAPSKASRSPTPSLPSWPSPATSTASSPATGRCLQLEDPDTEYLSVRAIDDDLIDSLLNQCPIMQTASAQESVCDVSVPALDWQALSSFVDDLSLAQLSPMFNSPSVPMTA